MSPQSNLVQGPPVNPVSLPLFPEPPAAQSDQPAPGVKPPVWCGPTASQLELFPWMKPASGQHNQLSRASLPAWFDEPMLLPEPIPGVEPPRTAEPPVGRSGPVQLVPGPLGRRSSTARRLTRRSPGSAPVPRGYAEIRSTALDAGQRVTMTIEGKTVPIVSTERRAAGCPGLPGGCTR
jgi:hypothetical protein